MSLSDREAHSFAKNDRKEISDCVCIGSSEAKESGESPDFGVKSVLEVFANVEGFGDSVVTIFLNSGNDEGGFAGIEEVPGLRGKFGEVDKEEVTSDAEDAGDETFDLEWN